MPFPSLVKLFELGGIGGVGVQSADGPAKGEFDIKLLSLRDLLSQNEAVQSSWIGPRKIGGTYFSGYNRKSYTVLDIKPDWITVRWEDGETASHHTPWNSKKDKVLKEPQSIQK